MSIRPISVPNQNNQLQFQQKNKFIILDAKKSEKTIEYWITNCKVLNFKTSQSEASVSLKHQQAPCNLFLKKVDYVNIKNFGSLLIAATQLEFFKAIDQGNTLCATLSQPHMTIRLL